MEIDVSINDMLSKQDNETKIYSQAKKIQTDIAVLQLVIILVYINRSTKLL